MKLVPEKKRRVLIVDDHPIVTKALQEMLNLQSDICVCGSADCQSDGLMLIGRLNPDLVVLDLSLRQGNGIELLKDIKAWHRKTPVLILTVHEEDVYAARAIRAGASGFVMKREAPENVIRAIREVLEGGVYLSGRMAKKMLFQCTGRTEAGSAVDALNDREFDVFKLIGKGFSTPEIAFQLHISAHTVESYRVEIRKKLKLNQSREVVRYAIEWNYRN